MKLFQPNLRPVWFEFASFHPSICDKGENCSKVLLFVYFHSLNFHHDLIIAVWKQNSRLFFCIFDPAPLFEVLFYRVKVLQEQMRSQHHSVLTVFKCGSPDIIRGTSMDGVPDASLPLAQSQWVRFEKMKTWENTRPILSPGATSRQYCVTLTHFYVAKIVSLTANYSLRALEFPRWQRISGLRCTFVT